MPVKCLGCKEVFDDHRGLREHQPECGPFVGAVWDTRSNLGNNGIRTDGGRL